MYPNFENTAHYLMGFEPKGLIIWKMFIFLSPKFIKTTVCANQTVPFQHCILEINKFAFQQIHTSANAKLFIIFPIN